MGTGSGADGAAPRAPVVPDPPPARLRAAHLEMVDAVLTGGGLERVAELAAAEVCAPVAIVVPRLEFAVVSPADAAEEVLPALVRYVGDRDRDGAAPVPPGVVAEAAIATGDDALGAVILLANGSPPAAGAADFLHLAAVASLTEVAIEDARDEVEESLRGSFIEDLRARPDTEPTELARRAARLGCNLQAGVVALCVEVSSERPRQVMATIASEHPGALAQHLDGRVYALLPALPGGAGVTDPETTVAAARRLAGRLGRHGPVGVSSHCAGAAELARTVEEAELVLEVVRQSGAPMEDDMEGGTYRLLFRVLASHPEEIRSFYEDTVAPLVRYDDQYATDLVGTLGAYLEQNCNMNATAAAIYAHRHTVAYRLERVRELTGLDPVRSEDRERLGLGLKAHRIIAPRLPR